MSPTGLTDTQPPISSLPSTLSLHRFEDRDDCAQALADYIATRLQHEINFTGEASLILSGGSTPLPMFDALSQASIDWSAVKVSLADDRWLPPEHSDSNQGKVEQHLLNHKAEAAQWIPLWNPNEDASDALTETQQQLSQLPKTLTLVVLGLGNDGHTASLFPCSEQLADLWETASSCAFTAPTTAPYQRMTLTPKRLLESQERILHICGADKLETLVEALLKGDRNQMPIYHFLAQPIRIFWAP